LNVAETKPHYFDENQQAVSDDAHSTSRFLLEFGTTGSTPMAQAALKIDPELTTAKRTGANPPDLGLPKFLAPDLCHDLFQETCVTLARCASDYNVKLVGAIAANANNIFEFAGELANATSWPEVVAAYTAQGRKQFDLFSTQAQEFSSLAQKATTEALAPIASTLPNILKTVAASS
jgi:hypothetical protein